MSREYFPKDVQAIAFSTTSSAFTLVNDSSGSKEYAFSASQIAWVKRGYADIDVATTSDFRIPTTAFLFLSLGPGEGLRVVGPGAGTLYVGDLSK